MALVYSAPMNTTKLPTGILVAIEGIDGAGKTTQAAMLKERLHEAGLAVIGTKEPTSGPWGQKLKQSAKEGRLGPEEELRLFMLDRREHIEGLIAPALQAGTVVVVDRYYLSSAAYQGARGMDPTRIIEDNEAFAPRPDLLVILDVVPRVGLARIRSRGDEANLFEREDLLAQSAAIFRALPIPAVVLDGALPLQSIHEQIVSLVLEGPLFQRLCLRGAEEPRCDPQDCRAEVAERCGWRRLSSSLKGR